MKIQKSGEDYLETILILEKKKGNVRSIDIANALDFSKPSVSRAMHILMDAGLIRMDESNQILLTEAGRARAEQVYERHCCLTQFLMMTLGVEEAVAAEDACQIEHVISQESFSRIKDYVVGHAAVPQENR